MTAGIFWIRWGTVLIFLVAALYGALKAIGVWVFTTEAAAGDLLRANDQKVGAALLISSIALGLLLLVLRIANQTDAAGRNALGWTAVLLGSDGRVSTSKAQVMLWTLGLAWASMYLSGIAALLDQPVFRSPDDEIWSDYLILLGGPFAAAVLAKLAVISKVTSGVLDKENVPGLADPDALGRTPAATTESPKVIPKGLVSNDAGALDVIATQYLVFNVTAFLYVSMIFISNNFDHAIPPSEKYTLPGVPAVLLALTSAAAATYVGNKSVQRSGPRIVTVTPNPVRVGSEITIRGVNLVPSSTPTSVAASHTSVSFTRNDGTVRTLGAATATAVVVTAFAPDITERVQVAVVTSLGVSTDPVPLEITA